MPMHDWTRVEAGIFHAFHHNWITAISGALNSGLLPPEYYALPEQLAAGFGPDILALQTSDEASSDAPSTGVLTRPKTRFMAEAAGEFYRRKKSSVVVRHISGDRMAVVEVMSPGNKSGRHAFRAFLDKACELLEAGVHLLIVDPFPPGPRDPPGIHAALWEQIEDTPFALPADKRLTFAAYESGLVIRAFVEPVAVAERLPEMPLFLEPDRYVPVPLEATYASAFESMPKRWRDVLCAPA